MNLLLALFIKFYLVVRGAKIYAFVEGLHE